MSDGGVIRQMRLDRGISIRELEKATGINRGRLSNIERGLPPSKAEVSKIIAALTER